MEIKLVRMTIQNFKSISSLTIDLNSKNATIYGDNCTGKTTVYDAFLWCLFGKDSAGKTSFDIKPVNAPVGTSPEVAVIWTNDGVHQEIRRKLVENWRAKPGTTEQEFVGNTVQFFINDIPLKKNEFESWVGAIVDEKVFRLITSTDAFFDLSAKERRMALMAIAGDVDDQIVAGADPDMLRLVSTMKAKGTDINGILNLVKMNLNNYKGEQSELTGKIKGLEEALKVEDWDQLAFQIQKLSEDIARYPMSGYETLVAELAIAQRERDKLNRELVATKTEYENATVNLDVAMKADIHKCPTCGQEIDHAKAIMSLQETKDHWLGVGREVRKNRDAADKQIADLEAKIEAYRKPEATEYLTRELEGLKARMALKEGADEIKRKIEDTRFRLQEVGGLIMAQEGVRNCADRYVAAKAKLLESKINALFPSLKFQLFEQSVSGSVSDVCIPLVRGEVNYYTNASRSERIRAGQEMISVLQQWHKILAPVFIDNAEAATWLHEMPCQTITMYVNPTVKELKVEVAQ